MLGWSAVPDASAFESQQAADAGGLMKQRRTSLDSLSTAPLQLRSAHHRFHAPPDVHVRALTFLHEVRLRARHVCSGM